MHSSHETPRQSQAGELWGWWSLHVDPDGGWAVTFTMGHTMHHDPKNHEGKATTPKKEMRVNSVNYSLTREHRSGLAHGIQQVRQLVASEFGLALYVEGSDPRRQNAKGTLRDMSNLP